MVGRHSKPEPTPDVPPQPWYVWLLLTPILAGVFVLAGWWQHYQFVPLAVGVAAAALSAVLQYRRHRRSRRSRPMSSNG